MNGWAIFGRPLDLGKMEDGIQSLLTSSATKKESAFRLGSLAQGGLRGIIRFCKLVKLSLQS